MNVPLQTAFRLLTLITVCIAGLGLFCYFVWPTQWRYDQVKMAQGTFPVRTHRITDRTEILLGPRGWVLAGDEDGPPAKPLTPISEDDLAKIQGTLEITDYGWLHLNMHNGTTRRLREVQIEVLIRDREGGKTRRLEYRLPAYDAAPFAAFSIKAECGCQLQNGQDFSWRTVSAKAESIE